MSADDRKEDKMKVYSKVIIPITLLVSIIISSGKVNAQQNRGNRSTCCNCVVCNCTICLCSFPEKNREKAKIVYTHLSCFSNRANELNSIKLQNDAILAELRTVKAEIAYLRGVLDSLKLDVNSIPKQIENRIPQNNGNNNPIIVYPPKYIPDANYNPKYEPNPTPTPKYEPNPNPIPKYETPIPNKPKYEPSPIATPKYEVNPNPNPRYEIIPPTMRYEITPPSINTPVQPTPLPMNPIPLPVPKGIEKYEPNNPEGPKYTPTIPPIGYDSLPPQMDGYLKLSKQQPNIQRIIIRSIAKPVN